MPTASAAASSEEPWALCHTHAVPKSRAVSAVMPEEFPTLVDADNAVIRNDSISVFSGNAFLRRATESLAADTVIYDEAKDTAEAQGNIHYQSDTMEVTGDAGFVELENETGHFDNAQFRFESQHARGNARVVIKESVDVTRLKDSTYTTCDAGREAWLLKASNVTLDQGSGMGEAYNATVRFMGVPFLYIPYISFPITDARKTGFLIPQIGTSSLSGTDIRIPYYLNLAPHRDATVTPRIMTERGVLVDTEFRYLNRASSGQVNVAYLPDDQVYGKDRLSAAYRHAANLARYWSSDLVFNYVSDKDYLGDFGSGLSVSSVTYLERHLDVTYQHDNIYFLTRVQGVQPVDNTVPSAARPYRRVPQMVFTFDQPYDQFQIDPGINLGMAYRLQSEWVRFDQEDQLTGSRLDLQPELSWPLQRAAGFVIPRLGLHYTRYDLNNPAAGTADALTRAVPVVTLDNGIFMERDMAWSRGGQALLHTLEPRLFYLYVPYRDQSTLPVFDSGAMDFNFSQLFRDNRFSGVDRVGDANQISAALTTRVLGRDNGTEYARLSVGQIYYLQDRRVTFPGGAVETRHNSDVVAEAAAALAPAWAATADAYWNPNLEQIDRGSVQIKYNPHKNSILNMAYRYRRDQTDQIDISTFFPVHRRWNLIGRWYYSIPDNRILESLAGLEYNSCCWAFTIVSRGNLTQTGEMNRSLMMQLELKGLMSVGSSVRTVLERGILGYQDEH